MWIILTKKIPVEVSPPIMSIHWAGASATDLEKARKQNNSTKENSFLFDKPELEDLGDKFFNTVMFKYEPKEEGSVWIVFDNTPIKIWPHEYNVLTKENFELYLLGENNDDCTMSHFPMYGRTPLYANPQTLDIEDRFCEYPRFDSMLYDAARIDGQNELQAFYTAICGYPLDLWFGVNCLYADIFGFDERDLEPRYKDDKIYESIKSGWQE